MIRVITIDDGNKSNKALIDLVVELSKKSKGILLDHKALLFIEEVEDELLVKKMKSALKGGFVNNKEKSAFLNKIGISNED